MQTDHVTEDEIKEKFVEAYNSLDRTKVIRNVESIKQVLVSSDKEKTEQKNYRTSMTNVKRNYTN